MSDNPFKAPESNLVIENTEGIIRHGNKLFIPNGSELPHRCVKCNAEARLPLITVKTYSYGFYPLIYMLVGWLIIYAFKLAQLYGVLMLTTIILARIFQKKFTTKMGLCHHHYRMRLYGRIFSFFGFILGMAVLIYTLYGTGYPNHVHTHFRLSFLIIFISIFGFWLFSRLPKISPIKNTGVFVKKLGKEF